MKSRLIPYVSPALLAALPLFLAALSGETHGQSLLVPWDQTWNFMHPTNGALPAGSGATEPNSGPTKWYADEATFAASYAGPSFATSGDGYEAGSGVGPLGYAPMDYFALAGAEFTAFGTTLTTPASGVRFTGYFRTTFTVPNDGNFYVNPVIRYILDDGGFVYLDGELVLRINTAAAAADNYLQLAANTTNTEADIRTADLSLAPGSSTGAGPAFAANATVIKRITNLSPGVHTLAVSDHNQATTSSDIGLAMEVLATPTNCSIAGAVSNVQRNFNGTPSDPSDDTISFTLNVSSTGTVGANWTITSPASLSTVTGAYNTNVVVSNVPIAEFLPESFSAPTNPGFLTVVLADGANPACTASAQVYPQHIIASDDTGGLNSPILTAGSIPNSGWAFDDLARSMAMINGGGGSRKVITSRPVDLSAVGAVQLTGVLQVDDLSSGTEAGDSFVAYAVIDGNTASPINLITAADTIIPDGVLSDDELAPTLGTFTINMSQIIPASANSLQIIIEGINDSNNESFLVRDFRISAAPPTLQATVGAATRNNQGTSSAADDTFSAPVTIEAANLGASTGWTSNSSPAAGAYTDPNPVTFGPHNVSVSPLTVTLTDNLNPAITANLTLTAPTPAITVSAPTNVVRNENGPGVADDTATFDVTIGGTNGGPGWATTTPGVTPTSGNFGTVTFTIAAPLPPSPVSVAITDVSYPESAVQNLSVPIPGRYVIGLRTYTGGPVDVMTPLSPVPPPEYINDPVARTLEVNNAGTPEKVLESEILDLSAVAAVNFAATLHFTDTSVGSNFETPDKFKAELIYEAGGVPATINLIAPYDVGDGASATTGTGLNGPPDGYLNGYSGSVGTDVVNGTVYASSLEDYNANRARDEINHAGQSAEENVDAIFNLTATIPANADNVKLRLSVVSLSGTERLVVSDILFSSSVVPQPIVPGQASMGLNPGVSGKMTAVALAALGSGGSGPLSVPAVQSGPTAGGGRASLVDGWVIYEPAAGFFGGDSFTYTLTDGAESVQGTVTVAVANGIRQTMNVVDITAVAGGGNSLTGMGIPGRFYRWETSPNLSNWSPLGSASRCPASGVMSIVDPPPLPESRFYRLVENGAP